MRKKREKSKGLHSADSKTESFGEISTNDLNSGIKNLSSTQKMAVG